MATTSAPAYSPLADDRRRRVLALRDLAVARLGVRPGIEWLFRPSAALLDVEPAVAAWYGVGAARAAAAALDIEREAGA